MTDLDQGFGARVLAARWVVTADLTLVTAAHLGGGDGLQADQTLLRDASTDRPLLTGTSLAGMLRSHLTDVLDGYGSRAEPHAVARLFGGSRGDDQGWQSPAVVFDGLAHATPVIRDGVALDAASGTAEDAKKFDHELLPAGTRFPLRVDLLVSPEDQEGTLLSLLATALEGLDDGVGLGARQTRGWGRVTTTNWRAVRFALDGANGWLEWLARTGDPVSETPCNPSATAALRAAASHPVDRNDDRRQRLRVSLSLRLRGPLLIRSPGRGDAPDAVHLSEEGGSLLPGTSLAGALRARARRIAAVVHGEDAAEMWAAALFGPRVGDGSLSASRLRVSEQTVAGGQRHRRARIQIDRVTQGVMPGALFDEEPHVGGDLSVELELRQAGDAEAGLLLLVVKDLLDGDLPVGGASSVGNGVVTGTGVVTFSDGGQHPLDPSQGGPRLQECVAAFHGATAPTARKAAR